MQLKLLSDVQNVLNTNFTESYTIVLTIHSLSGNCFIIWMSKLIPWFSGKWEPW